MGQLRFSSVWAKCIRRALDVSFQCHPSRVLGQIVLQQNTFFAPLVNRNSHAKRWNSHNNPNKPIHSQNMGLGWLQFNREVA